MKEASLQIEEEISKFQQIVDTLQNFNPTAVSIYIDINFCVQDQIIDEICTPKDDISKK